MKTKLLLLLLSFLLWFGFLYADLVIDTTWQIANYINTAVEIPPLWNLEYIGARFCDKWKVEVAENMSIRPWQTKDVCIVFYNKNTTGNDIKIVAWFTEGELQKNDVVNCQDTFSSWVFFSLLSNFKESDYTITLAPGKQLIRHIRVSIPQDMTGNIYGCVAYQLDQKKPENVVGMFYVVNRKAAPFYIKIQWDIYTYAWKLIDNIKFFRIDNQMIVLQTIAGILSILLIYYIVAAVTWKKSENHKKKQ